MGLVALLLLAVGAGLLWFLPRVEPVWYEPPDVENEQVVELAGTVENRFVEELHLVRDEARPWRLRIREEHVNAWLAVRLRAWIEHEQCGQWPAALHMVQAHFEEQGVSFAMDFREAGARQIITARIVPSIEDAQLRLRLDQVSVGRIPVTGDALEFLSGFLRERLEPETDDELDQSWLARAERLIRGDQSLPATITLSDGRRVEIDELICRRGAIELTSRTEARLARVGGE